MTQKVRKAMEVLERFESSGRLSREGKNWLIQATDPFHDTDIEYTGFPDMTIGSSVVQCVKVQTTLSKPSGITGNWDCHICNLPWFQKFTSAKYNQTYNQLRLDTKEALVNEAGGLAFMSVPSGATTYLTSSALGAEVTFLDINQAYFVGPARVVSAGFEVHNTTAELYRQGSVTVYKQPHPAAGDYTVICNTAAAPTTILNALLLKSKAAPPENVAQAMALCGSRTWAALEGAYVVCTLNTDEVPIQYRTPSYPILEHWSEGSGIVCGYTGTAADALTDNVCNYNEFDMSGAYFTGLSPETSLTVTFNVYIERFPTADQTDLAVLAEASPSYDPLALELYTRMLHEMPVGVMVKENSIGEWFADVVAKVAPFLHTGLSAIPHPYAMIGAEIAKEAGKLAKSYLPPKQGPNQYGDPLPKKKSGNRKAKGSGNQGQPKGGKSKKKKASRRA